MTHEELLEKINFSNSAFKVENALLAVMELHKPSNKHEMRSLCVGCYIPMPCPTIQAIEKGLK